MYAKRSGLLAGDLSHLARGRRGGALLLPRPQCSSRPRRARWCLVCNSCCLVDSYGPKVWSPVGPVAGLVLEDQTRQDVQAKGGDSHECRGNNLHPCPDSSPPADGPT